MSRVAKKPITLPKGVECTVAKDAITVKGPKGTLKMAAIAGVQIAIDKDKSVVITTGDTDPRRKEESLARGARLLIKPVRASQLAEALMQPSDT